MAWLGIACGCALSWLFSLGSARKQHLLVPGVFQHLNLCLHLCQCVTLYGIFSKCILYGHGDLWVVSVEKSRFTGCGVRHLQVAAFSASLCSYRDICRQFDLCPGASSLYRCSIPFFRFFNNVGKHRGYRDGSTQSFRKLAVLDGY